MGEKKGFKFNNGVIDLVPNIDGDFLPKSIDELRKDMPKKIVLDGVTEKEGIFLFIVKKTRGDLKNAIENLLSEELIARKVKNVEEAKKKLLMVYFKGIDTNNKKQLKKVYVDFMGEALNGIPNWELCHEMVENGHTVYQYMFEYINPKSFGWLKFLLPLISNQFFQ
uniref:Carboxylesterase type B domain-containing protein n=1 Tax=Acrobeloides nanus TaxID=290746 RepID=A0A914EQM4_9BILA